MRLGGFGGATDNIDADRLDGDCRDVDWFRATPPPHTDDVHDEGGERARESSSYGNEHCHVEAK